MKSYSAKLYGCENRSKGNRQREARARYHHQVPNSTYTLHKECVRATQWQANGVNKHMPTSCGLCFTGAYCTGLNGPRRGHSSGESCGEVGMHRGHQTSGKTLQEELLKGLGDDLLAPTPGT